MQHDETKNQSALLNSKTVIVELTGMPLSNCSLWERRGRKTKVGRKLLRFPPTRSLEFND